MAAAHRYLVQRVRSGGPLLPGAARDAAVGWATACAAAGVVPWGTFAGVLGLRTDELFLVAGAPSDAPARPALEGFDVAERRELVPTARPAAPERQTIPGVYVFRLFEIAPVAVDEFVRLSVEAWESFEHDPAYRAEPRALLRQDVAEDTTTMLLVTWYDGLPSWERSREPAPAARDNFQLRARLTRWALPIATRLVVP
jgi:hypothetical protein